MLEADGGTRTAAISGGYVALQLALTADARGQARAPPLTGSIAAVSCGVVEARLLDLDYSEDSHGRGGRERGDDGRRRPGRGAGHGRAHPASRARWTSCSPGGRRHRADPPQAGRGPGRLPGAAGLSPAARPSHPQRAQAARVRALLDPHEVVPLLTRWRCRPRRRDLRGERAAKAARPQEAPAAAVADDSGDRGCGARRAAGVRSARFAGGESERRGEPREAAGRGARGRRPRCGLTCVRWRTPSRAGVRDVHRALRGRAGARAARGRGLRLRPGVRSPDGAWTADDGRRLVAQKDAISHRGRAARRFLALAGRGAWRPAQRSAC